jgi:hypothetical protein
MGSPEQPLAHHVSDMGPLKSRSQGAEDATIDEDPEVNVSEEAPQDGEEAVNGCSGPCRKKSAEGMGGPKALEST